MIMSNSWDQTADHELIPNDVYDLLSHLSNDIYTSREITKNAGFIPTIALDGSQDASKVYDDLINKGQRFFKLTGAGSMYANAANWYAPLVTSDETLTLISLIEVLNDYIDKMTYFMRELSQKATNKHNLEVVKIDENALKHLQNKNKIWASQLQIFLKSIITNMFSAKNNKNITVTIGINEIDNNKIIASDTALTAKYQYRSAAISAIPPSTSDESIPSTVKKLDTTIPIGPNLKAPNSKPTPKPITKTKPSPLPTSKIPNNIKK